MASNIDQIMQRGPAERLHKWWCGLRGHAWSTYQENSAKRRCTKCGRVEWLFSRGYDSIDRPKYYWEEMIP